MRLGLSAIAVAAGCVAGGVACGFPAIEDEVVVQGRHIELHHDPSLPICAEAIESADRFLELAAELLDERPVDAKYYLYKETVEACRTFGPEAADCESRGSVYTKRWVHFHELVHVAAASWGAPPALFLEGLAEALGEPYPALYPEERADARIELDSVSFYTHEPLDNYRVAGDFVGYLIEHYGASRLRELSRSLLYLSDPIATWTRFRAVYGESLDDVIAAWRVATPGSPQFPLRRLRCEAPTIEPIATDTWAASEGFDCPSFGVTRPLQPVRRTFDVATAGLYTAEYELTDPSGRVSLVASLDTCDVDETEVTYSRFANDGTQLLATALVPGRYSLDIRSEHGDKQPSTLRYAVTPLVGDGSSCATPTLFTPPNTQWAIKLAGQPMHWAGRIDGRPDVAELWLRIENNPSTAINATLYVGEGAQLCNGDCTQPTNCIELTNRAQLWTPTPGEPIYVHVRAPIDNEVLVTFAGRP